MLDLPDEAREDPVFYRTNGLAKGRDGCRVPLPWSGTSPSYGFGPGQRSWLPQPPEWAQLSVEAQTGDPASTLELYRAALALRRADGALGDGVFRWRSVDPAVPGAKHVVAVSRPGGSEGSGGVLAVMDMGRVAVALPSAWGTEVLLASGPGVAVVDAGSDAGSEGPYVVLAPDTAAWMRS